MQTVSSCSSSCGDGIRTTSYQCQNVGDYDFSGGGYGAPEADSLCSSAKPSSSTAACSNYSGCSYDWVKPPATAQILPMPNPAGGTFDPGGAEDCSYARRTFAPYCQRTGANPVQLPVSDHTFCRNDLPDYSDVAAGRPDSLGYDRTTPIDSGCQAGSRDNKWTTSTWTANPLVCGSVPTQKRTATCIRKFNGATRPDSDCSSMTKPALVQNIGSTPDVSTCGFEWNVGAWSAYASTCSDSTPRTRIVTCRRSDGADVADSFCSTKSSKPATSENGSNLVGCTYEWTTPGAWTYASACSTNTSRTRTTSCRRSDSKTVADSSCVAGDRPSTFEGGVSNLSGCTYAPRDQGRTACTAQGTQQQFWDCTRSDGQTGFPASYCGKANPENLICTPPPPVYTYSPVNRGETACANSQKQVYWDCTRSDGATGFPASMCGKTNPETQSCVMPYTYSAQYRGETACSGGRKSVYWDCTRSDGQQGFPASMCGKTNPETQTCTMPVTYTPRYQGESACSNSQKQVYWDCLGSDGSSAPASACGKTNPEIQGCTMPVTYSWQTGGWSGYNSSCSASATRTRAVWCQGSDGQTYADASCGGGKPATSETTQVLTACSYSSEVVTSTSCINGSKTETMQCRRSDGNIVANSNCGTGDTRTQSCVMPKPTMCAAAPRFRLNQSGVGRFSESNYMTANDGIFGSQASFNSNGNDYPCGRTLTGQVNVVSNGVTYPVTASCASSGGPSCTGYKDTTIDGVTYRVATSVSSYDYSLRQCRMKVTIDAYYQNAPTALPAC